MSLLRSLTRWAAPPIAGLSLLFLSPPPALAQDPPATVSAGAPSGPFTLSIGSTLTSGSGTVSIESVLLRDCTNAEVPSAIGTTSTVTVDRSAPSVAVTSPNGGEHWAPGSLHAITWTASDVEGIAPAG